MRFLLLLLLMLQSGFWVIGQTYADGILAFRKQYTTELLADSRSPIKPSQLKYISFFPPDQKYCIWADFTETPGSKPFLVQTHSGKQKPFKEYGVLHFMLDGEQQLLHVYQSVDLVNDMAHKDDLFLPFNDLTNYETTFAGGRYIDLSLKDIDHGKILLDFNKCYNPYCAYSDGYSCPIPPKENYLHVEINAGEKLFQH